MSRGSRRRRALRGLGAAAFVGVPVLTLGVGTPFCLGWAAWRYGRRRSPGAVALWATVALHTVALAVLLTTDESPSRELLDAGCTTVLLLGGAMEAVALAVYFLVASPQPRRRHPRHPREATGPGQAGPDPTPTAHQRRSAPRGLRLLAFAALPWLSLGLGTPLLFGWASWRHGRRRGWAAVGWWTSTALYAALLTVGLLAPDRDEDLLAACFGTLWLAGGVHALALAVRWRVVRVDRRPTASGTAVAAEGSEPAPPAGAGRRGESALSLGLLALAAALALMGCWELHTEHTLQQHGITAQATVTRVTTHSCGTYNSSTCTDIEAHFVDVRGHRHEVVDGGPSESREGDQFTVTYDPADPDVNLRDLSGAGVDSFAFSALFVALAVGLPLLSRRRRRREALAAHGDTGAPSRR